MIKTERILPQAIKNIYPSTSDNQMVDLYTYTKAMIHIQLLEFPDYKRNITGSKTIAYLMGLSKPNKIINHRLDWGNLIGNIPIRFFEAIGVSHLIKATIELDIELFNDFISQTSFMYSNCFYKHKWDKEVLQFNKSMNEFDAISECKYSLNDIDNEVPFLTLVNQYYHIHVYEDETIYNYFRPEYKIVNNEYYKFKHPINI